MLYVGPHVSIAGGVFNAPLRAKELGATGFAMFTKNQRMWRAPALTEEECEHFRETCQSCGFSSETILPHDSYLINLAQPDEEKRHRAVEAFIEELRRCQQLGLSKLNFHPGSFMRIGTADEGLHRIASGVKQALNEVDNVTAVFENTAGQGAVLGKSLEELAKLLEYTAIPGRTGVCIDTCHAWAAGYDLVSEDGFSTFWNRFEKLIGWQYLKGMHLNDAKGEKGGNLDRHASIGQGNLGRDLFKRMASDDRFSGIPLILETPDETLWQTEIAYLLK